MKPKLESSLQIQTMRQGAGLTQTELAEKMGTSVRTVASWECGERHPKDYTFDQIEKVCNQHMQDKVKVNKSIEASSGKEIARMRNKARLTQPELAKKIGVNTRTLARWEGEDNVPKTGMIEVIAHICNQNGSMKIVESSTQEETYRIKYEEAQKEIIGVQKKVSELQERIIELMDKK
jgi:DNA-binding transcriptional regulator YiaG